MVWMDTPCLCFWNAFCISKSSVVFWNTMNDLWFESTHPVCVFETLLCTSKPSFVFWNTINDLWFEWKHLFCFWNPALHFKINLPLCFDPICMIYGLNGNTLFVFLKPLFAFQNLLLYFAELQTFSLRFENLICISKSTKVLMYMLGNPKLVVKTWRKRCYIYASGTIFDKVCKELKLWLNPYDEENELDMDLKAKRTKNMFRLKKDGDMYKMLGDAILKFIQAKPSPFPMATSSKQAVREMATWKRAMIAINLVRFATNIFANHHWYKFGYQNYKMNRRLFDLYCRHDNEIISSSVFFNSLAAVHVSTPPPSKKKRTRSSFELSSPEMPNNRRKRTKCVLSDSDEE